MNIYFIRHVQMYLVKYYMHIYVMTETERIWRNMFTSSDWSVKFALALKLMTLCLIEYLYGIKFFSLVTESSTFQNIVVLITNRIITEITHLFSHFKI